MHQGSEFVNVSSDTLVGVAAIAAFIGKTARQTTHLVENRRIPAFKLGDRWHMRRSTYAAHLSRLEADSMPRMAGAASEHHAA